MTDTPSEKEGTDYVDTEIAQVRLTAPGGRARTVIVPGEASVEEVERKARIVGSEVVGYTAFRVSMINGYGLKHDGGLFGRRNPNWEPRRRLEECA